MKKFLKYLAAACAVILIILYLVFLFVLPNIIDLNTYIPEVQRIVKEQSDIELEIKNPKVSTNWLLQAGIKTGQITAKLPDGSYILEADGIKFRISLPNLLFLTVKASCLEINSPKINLEIKDGEQFKVVRLVEDILNKKKDEPASEPLPILSKIKYKVPNAKINNYTVSVVDLKTGHKLSLNGDKLSAGYNHLKTAKIKTVAEILSDDKQNIRAALDINSYIPPIKGKNVEDDPAEKIELPFVNPVLVYRNYDLKSDIFAKLKIRQDKTGQLKIKGHANIENATMNLSGYQLPTSYIRTKFNGHTAQLDTNLEIAKNQAINLFGKFDFGKNSKADLTIFTDKIYFNDVVILSKAVLDTLHIKNNLSYIKANGYLVARTSVKTNFKKLKSSGSIIARNGNITNGATNLVFDKINANLIFENNKLEISDTHTFVNGNILKAEGTIDSDSYSDITVHSEKLPIPGLFRAFAPADLKKSISLTSGALSVDAKIQGKLKQAIAYANIILENLSLNNSSTAINNEKLIVGAVTDLKTIDGNISNKNLKITLPSTGSTILSPSISIKLNEQDIEILPASILINSVSKIGFSGSIKDYSSASQLTIKADGAINADDLKKFAGTSASPFIDAKGNLLIKSLINGTGKKQAITVQLKSDENNYVTPVNINSMNRKQSILQAKIDTNGKSLHIRQTGFYTDSNQFTDDFEANLSGTQKIAEISGTIAQLNTAHPFINIIRLDIPSKLKGSFSAFKNSQFNFEGGAIVFGKLNSPLMRGNFKINDLQIPELLTTMNLADLDLSGKNINLDIRRLLLNGSDINLRMQTDIEPHPKFTISSLNLRSNLIDVDNILKVPELLSRYTVSSTSSTAASSDIPVVLQNGLINIRNLKSGNIITKNTTGRISLHDNNLFLTNLNTNIFDGVVGGNITVNLLSNLITIKTNGSSLNVEKALFTLANLKDTLTGTLTFITDLTLHGTTTEDIMKNLKGDISFVITDGQLGPFGKIENMILAENVRESQFFQTALGGVINNLTSIDTSHFKIMDGFINFENGIAHINPITTIGPVMSMHIAGDFNLLQNNLEMKVRAKLASVIANMLGPLSQLNPINLVQATPGLNVVMAKTFFLFCEQLTPEESSALPHLETDLDDKMATKFQIVLRGDVAKPLTLVKSFKWLALSSEIEKAKNFVDTLPDPSIVEDPNNATIEAIMQAQQEKAKEDAKLKNRIKRFFTKS